MIEVIGMIFIIGGMMLVMIVACEAARGDDA